MTDLKARVRRSLPSVPLESIRIASPCTASWADMRGDAKSRHCGQCDRAVHDLSAMTRAEAEALVTAGADAGGHPPCVRLWVRSDGTVLTQDCPVGLAKLRRHLARVGAALGALLGLVGCTREVEQIPLPWVEREEVFMGRMVCPPMPPTTPPPATVATPPPATVSDVETATR